MIIDIDFRYVERDVTVYDGSDFYGRPDSKEVLQWRKKVLDPSKSPEPTWTDWQDVRTETE